MDKITELEPRGAALKAELAEYRQRFRTRSISLELKRAAVAFVDEGIAAGMWQGHAAQLIGSSASTVEKWREAIADAEMETAGLLPVRVADDPSRPKPPPRVTGQPVLVSPGGWRIEGLALPDLLALLPTLP